MAGKPSLADKFEEALDSVPPSKHNEAITAAMHLAMTEDNTLQRCLADLTMRLRRCSDMRGLEDFRVIMLNIIEDDFKYEPFVLFVGMMEFVFYLARKAVDMQKLSPFEYYKFREHMRSIGFPHMGFADYPKSLGEKDNLVERELEDKELARRQLTEKYKDDPETMKLFEKLDILKPITVREIERVKVANEEFYDIIDEYCKFSNLGEKGAPLKVLFMKFVLEKLGIVPGLNAGMAPIEFMQRTDGESSKEFKDRVAKLCGDITKKMFKDLGDHPEKHRFGIMAVSLGEMLVQGIIPDTELEVMDKSPAVQAFISNLRKGAKSQIKDEGTTGAGRA